MKIASVLLAVLASTSVHASKNSPVDVILSRQCGGNYQLLPKLPFGMAVDVPALERGFTAVFTKLRARANCQCPNLSENDFDLMFDPITGILNAASSTTKYPTGCAAGLFPRNFTDFADAINVNLPETCTLTNWQTKGECAMKLAWSPTVTFGVALQKCPNSRIPAFTVNCIGCTDLLKPCMADMDCGVHKCNNIGGFNSHQDTVASIYQAFKQVGLFDDGDPQPGCSQKNFDPNASNDMLTSALSFLKNEIYGDGGEVSELKLCGMDQFTNANLTGMMSFVEHPLTPARCYDQNESLSRDITIKDLQAWPEGQTVLAAPPVLPAPSIQPATGSRFRFFQFSCDGQISLFNGAARIRTGQNFVKTFEKAGRMLFAMEKCRRGGLMLNQFLTRFGLWSMYPYLYSLDGNSYPDYFNLGPVMSDWTTQMFTRKYKNDNGYYQQPTLLYGLPTTCNFEHLINTGACSVQYTGVSSLVNMDLQMELHASTCTASSSDTPMFIQSFAIDMTCGGANCDNAYTPRLCDSNADCYANMECIDIKKTLPPPANSGDLIGDFLFPIRDINVQPVAFSGTLCNSSNVGYTSDYTCGGELKNDQDISYVISQFAGMDPNIVSNGGIKVCSFDHQTYNATQISNWAMSQANSKENGYYIANLHPAQTPNELLIGSATPAKEDQTMGQVSSGSMLNASFGVGFAAMVFAYFLI